VRSTDASTSSKKTDQKYVININKNQYKKSKASKRDGRFKIIDPCKAGDSVENLKISILKCLRLQL